MVESDEADSCDSDTEPDGKTRPEAAIKRQQVATKQKRMMGNNSSGKSTADADEEDEELPRKIVDVLVLGLPFELTEDQLRNHFETFGKVVHCEVCLSIFKDEIVMSFFYNFFPYITFNHWLLGENTKRFNWKSRLWFCPNGRFGIAR
jgi:hypothetical protein